MARSISYAAAEHLLQGHVLVKTFTNTKHGCEFLLVGENGGRVTEAVAARLLAHPDCYLVDEGLLPDAGQSFSLHCWE